MTTDVVSPSTVAAVRALSIDLATVLLDPARRPAPDPAGAGNAAPNLVCSGFGVWCAAAVLLAGARGATADELAGLLRADRAGAVAGLALLDQRLTELGGAAHAMAAWSRVPTYRALREAVPAVAFSSLDDPLDLDAWVAEHTHGLITEMPVTITPDVLLVLADVVTLFASWQSPFAPGRTVDEPFTPSGGNPRRVPTMHQSFTAMSNHELGRTASGTTVFGLPCATAGPEVDESGTWTPRPRAHLRLALGAPGADPAAVVGDLLRGEWEPEPADLVNLALPRFSLESTIDLLPVLAALGMVTATTDAADFGDLSPEPLRVDQFTQQAVVDVDEEGVRAAAVTVVAMARAAGPRPDPVVLDLAFDRPFAFALVDPELGLPLFTGWVADPGGPGTAPH